METQWEEKHHLGWRHEGGMHQSPEASEMQSLHSLDKVGRSCG